MKIKSWNDDTIFFSDGSTLFYEHYPECCERNWADFSILDTFYNDEEFDSYYIKPIDDAGFLLCMVIDKESLFDLDFHKKIFIPCYSDQNGYYSNMLTIVITTKEGSEFRRDLSCDMQC